MLLLSLMEISDNKGDAYAPNLVLAESCADFPATLSSTYA